MQRKAFTLVELMVVVAIIALLACLLLPVLNHAKQQAQGVQCLSNLRQLTLAWKNYADENNSQLPLNIAEDQPYSISQDWILGVEGTMADRADNTNTLLLTEGLIGPYIKTQAKIFKCPSDTLLCTEGGAQYDRVRSISMNCFVGSFLEDAWAYGETSYYIFEKESQIIRPSPSQLWVMIDEDALSINDGFFLYYEFLPRFLDRPATYHDGATSFAFADGHVEIHRWFNNFQGQDINWMSAHTTAKLK